MSIAKKFLLITILTVLVSSFIIIASLPKKTTTNAAFIVLVNGKKTIAPEQSYPEVNSSLSFEYKQLMAKTLLEHNQND